MLGKIDELSFHKTLYAMNHAIDLGIAALLSRAENTGEGRVDRGGRAAGLSDDDIALFLILHCKPPEN